MKDFVTLFAGVIIGCLGLLWFLQGADIVHLEAILCFSNCEPIVGGSLSWGAAGVITLMIGIAMISRGFHQMTIEKS